MDRRNNEPKHQNKVEPRSGSTVGKNNLGSGKSDNAGAPNAENKQ